MRKSIAKVVSLLFLMSLLTGCAASQVTSVGKTDTDAPEKTAPQVEPEKPAVEEKEIVEDRIYQVGDRVVVDDKYALTITGIRETDERNQFSDKQVAQVLIIDYLYENISDAERDLYISDMNFKAVDEGGNMCDSYPVSITYTTQHAGVGTRVMTGMAIGTTEASQKIRLQYYDDYFSSEPIMEFEGEVGKRVEPSLTGSLPSYPRMFSVGEIIEVKTDQGDYTIAIDKVEKTKDRNEYSDMKPEEVYKVTYTYSNISCSSNLYLSEMNFQLIDSQGNVGFSYPGGADRYPQETIKGARCTAEMVFGAHKGGENIILSFKDNMFSDVSDVKIAVDGLN